MNFSMGNSGRQGFYDEDEQQQGKHLHQYPCSNSSSSSSPNYEKYQHHHHHHRGWLGSQGCEGGGGAPSSQLELPPVTDEPSSRGGGGSEYQVPPVVEVEREHMFDKVVTPSDVGKLNRLVIPKQHAERYFPLDSSTNEKGLLLNFEDRNGKPWRFRYSYWNSSQSYVMTKGWSRFVKEKKLDAGDIVSFQRGVGDFGKDRLFIDWRRRPDHHAPSHHPQLLTTFPHHHHLNNFSFQRSSTSSAIMNNIIHHQHQHQHQHPNPMVPWNPIFLQSQQGGGGGEGEGYGYGLGHQSNSYGGTGPAAPNYSRYNTTPASTPPCPGSVIYLRSVSAPQQQLQLGMQQVQIQQQRGIFSSGLGIDQVVQPPVVFESVPVVHGQAATTKRLRLFGVNMDFPSQELPLPSTNDHYSTTSSSSSSSSTIPYIQLMPNYNPTPSDKPKASMSLDLDI